MKNDVQIFFPGGLNNPVQKHRHLSYMPSLKHPTLLAHFLQTKEERLPMLTHLREYGSFPTPSPHVHKTYKDDKFIKKFLET